MLVAGAKSSSLNWSPNSFSKPNITLTFPSESQPGISAWGSLVGQGKVTKAEHFPNDGVYAFHRSPLVPSLRTKSLLSAPFETKSYSQVVLPAGSPPVGSKPKISVKIPNDRVLGRGHVRATKTTTSKIERFAREMLHELSLRRSDQ